MTVEIRQSSTDHSELHFDVKIGETINLISSVARQRKFPQLYHVPVRVRASFIIYWV